MRSGRCFRRLRARLLTRIWKKVDIVTTLAFGYWQTASTETWWPAEWWRRETSKKHHPPTAPSSPAHTHTWTSFKSFDSAPIRAEMYTQRVLILTAWQSANRNFFVVQTMKMMEAKTHHLSVNLMMISLYSVIFHALYSPRTAKMSVLVKCLYKDNFTGFLLSFRVLMVCARLTNMCNTVKELSHWHTGP